MGGRLASPLGDPGARRGGPRLPRAVGPAARAGAAQAAPSPCLLTPWAVRLASIRTRLSSRANGLTRKHYRDDSDFLPNIRGRLAACCHSPKARTLMR